VTRKEIIQALKDNEKPFDLMSTGMQLIAKGLGKNGYFGCWDERGWTELNNDTNTYGFDGIVVYRLRPDYEEKPEIEKCEVKDRDGHLHFTRDNTGHALRQAYDENDFFGFQSHGGFIWGKLYRNLETGEMELIIPVSKIAEYEVVKTTQVLFQKETNE
jgi:hypothetical protein